jgi:hypothetical protein
VATTAVPSLTGQQSVDGVLVPLGSTVLLTAQSTSLAHGIWQVNSGAWTRVDDMAASSYVLRGTLCVVTSGTTNANTIWQATSASGWVGVNANSWTKIGSVATTLTPVAGNGIAITGSAPSQNFAVQVAPAVSVGTGTALDPVVSQPRGISVTSAGVAVDPVEKCGEVDQLVHDLFRYGKVEHRIEPARREAQRHRTDCKSCGAQGCWGSGG